MQVTRCGCAVLEEAEAGFQEWCKTSKGPDGPVDCAQGRHRRHLDQLRRRAESTDSSDLNQTSKQELSEDTGVQDSPEETMAESATPPLLRRSTRPRKPPERYGF
ncbi:hypothetical protein HPB50_011152 [Hyalomma asiaticum]|uniref:Uncharacterized protein n=1 Tax=Hyalomma asiaticum TaxID=266040 RepID=A0ACB7TGC5_HYAAI|nr:hypothetical protein HPB50_011152 [Hyalomma asiaticum]